MLMPATGRQGIAQVRRHEAGDIGHHRLDAADLQRIDVVDHRAAVLAVERSGAHVGTVGDGRDQRVARQREALLVVSRARSRA